ncbi:MAG TPA: M28 family peptidase [Bacteroidota bacterium]|nr:M28 family peptidase [Bacteroidota bacterium]
MKSSISFLLLTLLLAPAVYGQSTELQQRMAGSAFLDNASYDMLMRLSDEAGGRWIGSAQNELGMRILMEELRKHGLEPRLERFTVPGWVRGKDEVRMLQPSERVFRAVALGYVDRTPAFEAPLAWGNRGYAGDFDSLRVSGAVALVTQEALAGREELLRAEAIANAARAGARAILFINDKKGRMTLSGMSNFHGEPAAIPAYSLTWEEGQRLRRLLERGVAVNMRITTESHCLPVESANVVCTFPGRRAENIVVGAHFDSWDVGQGSIDNGLGTAILFDVARILRALAPSNERGIELVWFNGEEMGLWGARKYVEMHAGDAIAAMVNMDMTGSPRGFNAMGSDHLVPLLAEVSAGLRGFEMSRGIMNRPWTNSDHQPFMTAGIPTITPLGHLDKEMVETYHDFGDTFDLVNKRYLSEAAAVVSILTHALANHPTLPVLRRSAEETRAWLTRFGLESRLRKQGEWPGGE